MISSIAPTAPIKALPMPLAATSGARPGLAPSPLGRGDRFERAEPSQLKTDRQIKEFLAPVFDKLAKAGYGDAVEALKKSHFRISGGKFLNVEYFAATSSFNNISLSAKEFFSLGPNGMASVLLHESVHLRQSLFKRVGSTIISGWGKFPKLNYSEIEAYKKEWAANDRLGLCPTCPDSIIWYSEQIALEEAGVLPKKN